MKPRIRIEANSIFDLAERALFIRARANQDIHIEFNGYLIEVNESSSREQIVEQYFTKLQGLAA